MSSTNIDSFTSSFRVLMPFISFSCLTALPNMLSKSGENRHPCLVSNIRRITFTFSLLKHWKMYVSCEPLLCGGMFILHSFYWDFYRRTEKIILHSGYKNIRKGLSFWNTVIFLSALSSLGLCVLVLWFSIKKLIYKEYKD